MTHDLSGSDQQIYEALCTWLSKQPGGLNLLEDFERNPEEATLSLRALLEETGIALPAILATYVSGGKIGKLVNIAQAGTVQIHLPLEELALAPSKLQELEHRYLRRVATECRYLETEGVIGRQAELTGVFVVLEAIQDLRSEDPLISDVAPVSERQEQIGIGKRDRTARPFRDHSGKSTSTSPLPLFEVLKKHKHLVILGEPGTGKTTTLQFIALCFSRSMAKAELDLDEVRIPVRVDLKGYTGSYPLGELLVEAVAKIGQFSTLSAKKTHGQARALVGVWIKKNRLAILLDGLDEVPRAHCKHVVQAIERFAATPEGRHSRIVVTSRIAGYREARRLRNEFGHYTICPFSGVEDALPYVAGWLAALKGIEDEVAQQEAQTLLEQINQRTGLRRVMGNPLLLRLIIALYAENAEGFALPEGRTGLYRRYVTEVVWERVEGRGEALPWSFSQVEGALEEIAWSLNARGEQTALSLTQVVEREFPTIDGRRLLDDLRERIGLLATYDYEHGGLIAFRHLTFQEYFIAQRLAKAWRDPEHREHTWHLLRPRLHHPSWREPILLLAGTLKEEHSTDLVERILDAGSLCEKELHRNLFLAADILIEGVPVSDETKAKITSGLVDLFREVNWWVWGLIYIGITVLLNLVLARYIPWLCGATILGILVLFVLAVTNRTKKLPVLSEIFLFPVRLSGWYAFPVLQEQVVQRSNELPEPQRTKMIDDLVEISRSRIWESQRAVQALGDIGHSRATIPLIEALSNSNVFISFKVKEALIKLGDPRAVELLIKALESEDGKTRSNAAEALGKLGDSRAVEPLIKALGSEDGKTRSNAAEALGKLGDSRAVESLIKALGSEDGKTRSNAAEALGKLGDSRAVEPLIKALGSEDGKTRSNTAEALGKLGDLSAIEPLLGVLRDGSVSVRGNAAEALGRLGDSCALEALIEALKDEEGYVRRNAAKALAALGDSRAVEPLIKVWEKGYEGMRDYAAKAIKKIDDPLVVDSLVTILKDQGTSVLVQQQVIEILKSIGDPRAVGALTETLGHWHPSVRYKAAEALMLLDGEAICVSAFLEMARKEELVDGQVWLKALGLRNLDFIAERLEDEDPSARLMAAEFLAICGDRRAIDLLAQVLEEDNTDMRRRAAGFLGLIVHPRAVRRLIEALKDKEVSVRERVAESLGRIGDPSAVEPLIAAMKSKENVVRASAAKALGQIGEICAVEPLIVGLGDEEAKVRREAAAALGRLGDSRALKPLIKSLYDKDPVVRLYATTGLRAIGDCCAVEHLIEMLNDDLFLIRESAVLGLREIGDLRAVKPLIGALRDQEAKVRSSAAKALGALGDSQAIEPLIEALRDQEAKVRREAAEALGMIGDSIAVNALVEASRDENITVQWEIAKALGKIGYASVDRLIIALGDDDFQLRSAAEIALEQVGIEAMTPLIKALRNRNPNIRWGAATVLQSLVRGTKDIKKLHSVVKALKRRLIDQSIAKVAFKSLQKVVARLTVLEVENSGPPPSPFDTVSQKKRSWILIVINLIVITLSNLLSNILASYLQDHYKLDSGMRIGLVFVVFIITLAVVLWLNLKRKNRLTY